MAVNQEQNQNQNNNQTQNQNNNQSQNNNQNVNAQGGSSSSSSSSNSSANVTINNNNNNPSPSPTSVTYTYYYYNDLGQRILGTATKTVYLAQASPTPTTTYYQTKGGEPQVVGQVQTDVKELPRTGLPLLALGLAGILPGGLILKRFSKKETEEDSASSIWTKKQLKN